MPLHGIESHGNRKDDEEEYKVSGQTFPSITTTSNSEGHPRNCEKVWKKTTTKLVGDSIDLETDLWCVDKKSAPLKEFFHGQWGKILWKQNA